MTEELDDFSFSAYNPMERILPLWLEKNVGKDQHRLGPD